jgi:hypothetical protein
MSIEVYAFEDKDGNEDGTFTTRDIEEAKRHARKDRLRMMARVFEYTDSELVEDNSGTDDSEDDDGTPEESRPAQAADALGRLAGV